MAVSPKRKCCTAGEVVGFMVPTYFSDLQCQATKDRVRATKLNVLRIIKETTTATIAYELD